MGDDEGGKRRRDKSGDGGARDGERVEPSPGKRTRTQRLTRRRAQTAASGAAVTEPTVWPRPKGCPPHLPYGIGGPVCDTGRLGELVRFTLRQAGAPNVWPGWAVALSFAHADRWAERFRGGQTADEVHPDPAWPAATMTITAALASCEPVLANEPTYQAELVFEVLAELPDYGAGAPAPASVEADSDASSALRSARQTLRTGSITFTLAPAMVDYDHALPREPSLNNTDVTGGPLDADQGDDEIGARTTTAAPPPAPAPPTGADLLAVAARPADAAAEVASLRAELEAGLGRPLTGAELARLTSLAIDRAAALERLDRQRQLRALYDAELAALQAQRDAALDAEVYEQPSIWAELGDSAIENGPVRIGRDMWHGFEALVQRSGELQREAIARGDYRGAAFAAPAAIVEQTFESISGNLRMTSDGIERVLEARSTTDAVIGSTEAVLGIGFAALDAWTLVEPVAAMRRGGGAGPGLRLVEAGAGSSAGQIAAAGVAVAEGSLSRPAIVLAVARLRDADADALGDGPEADAVNEARNARAAGMVPEEGAELVAEHHVLPQEERAYFKLHDIDVDEFCIKIDEARHQAIHGGGDWKLARNIDDAMRGDWVGEWNSALMERLHEAEARLGGELLSRDEIIDIAREQLAAFRLPADAPFHRYTKAKKPRRRR